ncbi:hypothetical protein EDB84DRAFT_1439053 [Lactarius hengduanensis]|nr:hypothetical protein EDB84DRAFT_1439053 [Lactarius hengduanensis]
MAQSSGDETRPYSPSKLTNLPPLKYATPSLGPLNNSGAYSPAAPGPIIAPGNGQPRRRDDGQAYWDDTAPTITIPASSSPAAGRSPQDSKMNSPESEEPTVPAIATTQVGPATMQALNQALDTVAEHADNTQQLWDNVPSLPSPLPPQPEVIEVRGHITPASRTPHGRSRAASNASVWSRAMVESASAEGSPVRFPSDTQDTPLAGRGFSTALQALKAGLLSDPYDPAALDTTYINRGQNTAEDENNDKEMSEIHKTLKEELARDVVEQLIGWGGYHLSVGEVRFGSVWGHFGQTGNQTD